MLILSSTCLAIASADKAGTLRIYEREGRFGVHAVIADNFGVIETPNTLEEANERVNAIRERIA